MGIIIKKLGRNFLFVTVFNVMIMQITNLTGVYKNIPAGMLYAQSSQTEKEVAITIDDLPFVGCANYDLNTLKELTGKLMNSLKENNVPAIGFVVEERMYKNDKIDTGRVSLLKMWLDAGMELGNHTYSHPSLNSISLQDYEQDFLKGNNVVKALMSERGQTEKYFRYPFLHTGITIEAKTKFEEFLSDNKYKIAPVTIDNSEWIFNKAYETAYENKDSLSMKKIGEAYIPYMRSKFEFFEKNCQDLFGRNIKQILLIHANHLNADYFSKLAGMMKQLGYKFVSLDRVLQDEAYKSPDTYTGRGGITWIHRWAITAGKKKDFFRDEPLTPKYIMEIAGITEE